MNRAIRRAAELVGLLLLLFTSQGVAQEQTFPRYGIYGGLALNRHSTDFRALPGIPNCCPIFTSGSGTGPFGGFLFETPLSNSLLAGMRIGYRSFDADLSESEPVYLIVNGNGVDGTIEHNVQATVGGLTFEPEIRFRLAGNLFVNVGPSVAMLLAASYQQGEELITPSNSGTFLDSAGNDSGSKLRNQREGDIPENMSLLLHGNLGLGYEIPLGKKSSYLLVPEISYSHALNNLVDGLTWKPNALRFGIALKYSPPPRIMAFDTLFARDTTTRTAPITTPRLQLVESSSRTEDLDGDTVLRVTTITERYLLELPEPTISGAITAFGLDESGVEEPIARVRVEEFLSSIAHPLLAYIFFAEGSSTVPDRYTNLTPTEAASFRKESLYSSGTLEVNHNVLNIIGQRMKEFPNAKLTLTGCNSDEGLEKGDSGLSRSRAETIRDYLLNVWKVSPGRITLTSQNLPNVPSNPKTLEGKEENRRVEITSNEPAVTELFQAFDTARVTNPPIVRLKLNAAATKGVANWKLTINQENRELRSFSGTGIPPAYVDWDLQGEKQTIPRVGTPLEITVELRDPDGRTAELHTTLPTEVITIKQKKERGEKDYRIDRYSLVLFDFNRSGINAAQQRVVDLVKSNLKPTSELTIEGFTDRTGSDEGNRKLSTGRADATAQALGRTDATVIGRGESRLLYTNDLPEGRFLCRTVQITAKTPVE